MRILEHACSQPVAVCMRPLSGGSGTIRVSLKQNRPGEARNAILALLGGIMRLKQVQVFDEDIDVRDDRQVEWAFGTRFQGDEDIIVVNGMMGMPMDPSLGGPAPGPRWDLTAPGRSVAAMRSSTRDAPPRPFQGRRGSRASVRRSSCRRCFTPISSKRSEVAMGAKLLVRSTS